MPCWRPRVAAPVFPCQCVSASVSRRGRPCVPAPLWPPQPRAASGGKIPPAASLSWPALPGREQGSRVPAQLCSDQQTVMAATEAELCLVAHRLAPCQNVRCELRKDAENCAVSWVKPRLFVYLTCVLDLVEKWFLLRLHPSTVLVM